MTRNPALLAHRLDGELVLYDPDRDIVHTLNETAWFIWERCERPSDDIAEALRNRYNVPAQNALNDVEHVLRQFHQIGLLQRGPIE